MIVAEERNIFLTIIYLHQEWCRLSSCFLSCGIYEFELIYESWLCRLYKLSMSASQVLLNIVYFIFECGEIYVYLTKNFFPFQSKMESFMFLHRSMIAVLLPRNHSLLCFSFSQVHWLRIMTTAATCLGIIGLCNYDRKMESLHFLCSTRTVSIQSLLMDSFITCGFKYSFSHATALSYFPFLSDNSLRLENLRAGPNLFIQDRKCLLWCFRLQHPVSL